MSDHVILNNIDHANLGYNKSDLTHAEYKSMCFPILVEEIDTLQCEYPIFFLKTEKELNTVVLCGFEQGENLYLEDNQWQATFRPLYTKKGPFFISVNPESGKSAIAVNMKDSRVSDEFMSKLFTERGGNSEELNDVRHVLEQLGQGMPTVNSFTQLLESLELLEPFNLEVSLSQNKTATVNGLSTINEEKLSSLPDETILMLNKNGAMKKIHHIVGSVNNVRKLINRKVTLEDE